MTTEPNIPALTKLAEWLEAGAPHAVFDISVGLCPLDDDSIYESTDFSSVEEYVYERGVQPGPDCGTVCCIAGAAYMMSCAPEGQMFPSPKEQVKLCDMWSVVRTKALAYLGLPADGEDVFMGNDLFDSKQAPENCTPAQAAAAVRRVIAGKRPWPLA